jgi:hypothetical protein
LNNPFLHPQDPPCEPALGFSPIMSLSYSQHSLQSFIPGPEQVLQDLWQGLQSWSILPSPKSISTENSENVHPVLSSTQFPLESSVLPEGHWHTPPTASLKLCSLHTVQKSAEVSHS